MPGSASRSRRARSRSAPALEIDGAVAQRRAHAAQRLAAALRHREHVVVGGGDAPRVGKTCVSDPSGAGQRLAVALHDARGVRARGRDRDLLAEHGAHDDLRAVDAARHAQPGARGDERREQRVAREHRGDRDGVGVEVEQPAAARDGDAEVAHVGEAQRALHAAVAGRELDDRGAVRAGAACAGRRPPPSPPRRRRSRASRRTRTALRPRSARGREGGARSCRRRPRSAGRAAAAARAASARTPRAPCR